MTSGAQVEFVYLMHSDARLLESLDFLGRMGVRSEQVLPLGRRFGSKDHHLVDDLPRFYSSLEEHLAKRETEAGIKFDYEFVCTAYEGGPQDHDANSLLARALAQKFDGQVIEYFTYNGYGTKGKIYKVANAIGDALSLEKIPYSWQDLKQVLIAPWIFKSQAKAMLGLWPFLVFKATFGPLLIRRLSKDFALVPSHSETPHYERWGRTTEKTFLSTVESFDFFRR